MDKLSYFRNVGINLGLKLQLEAEVDHVEKVASAGGQIEDGVEESLAGLAEQFEFQDAQNAVSYDTGAYEALAKIAAAFESSDTDAEELYGEIKEAMFAIEAGLPDPQNDQEHEEMVAELIKGASEGLAIAQAADEITEEMIDTAADLVVGMLSDEG